MQRCLICKDCVVAVQFLEHFVLDLGIILSVLK
jgi:hypothetical protein